MKSLNTILKNKFIETFENQYKFAGCEPLKFKKSTKLSELIKFSKSRNSSNPYQELGRILTQAVDEYENQ